MNRFIGTKIVSATPMTRLAWCEYRGWPLPANEDGADAGYMIEYLDGGKPNIIGHAGYVTWTPKAAFDGAYRTCEGMTFGMAVEALKAGHKVSRTGWNGNGMWIEYRPENGVSLAHLVLCYPVNSRQYPNGAIVTWAPSQTDMLADDWIIRRR